VSESVGSTRPPATADWWGARGAWRQRGSEDGKRRGRVGSEADSREEDGLMQCARRLVLVFASLIFQASLLPLIITSLAPATPPPSGVLAASLHAFPPCSCMLGHVFRLHSGSLPGRQIPASWELNKSFDRDSKSVVHDVDASSRVPLPSSSGARVRHMGRAQRPPESAELVPRIQVVAHFHHRLQALTV